MAVVGIGMFVAAAVYLRTCTLLGTYNYTHCHFRRCYIEP